MKRFVSVLLLLVMMTTCLTVHAESESAAEDKGTAETVLEEDATSQEETVQPESDKEIHLVRWDESIELDFIHLSIEKAKIYKTPEQLISAYEGNYKLGKGKQYFNQDTGFRADDRRHGGDADPAHLRRPWDGHGHCRHWKGQRSQHDRGDPPGSQIRTALQNKSEES